MQYVFGDHCLKLMTCFLDHALMQQGEVITHSEALKRAKQAQQSIMRNKIWLSLHPTKFGCDKIIHSCINPFMLAMWNVTL